MCIDAIALLPRPTEPLIILDEEEGWGLITGPARVSLVGRVLNDAVLLSLGLSIKAPDSELYEAAWLWLGTAPERVWVFPDRAIAGEKSEAEVQRATADVGRWLTRSERASLLDRFGFVRAEAEAWEIEALAVERGG